MGCMEDDHVAGILAAWQAERPDLDVTAIGVFARITRIASFTSGALREVYRRYGLDGGEYDVLAALLRSGTPYRLTPSKLYRALLVTSATMTERLDKMERRGLVRRSPSRTDRRSVQVQLTAKGRDVIDRAAADLVAAEQTLLADLPKQDISRLAGLLARLCSRLETPGPGKD